MEYQYFLCSANVKCQKLSSNWSTGSRRNVRPCHKQQDSSVFRRASKVVMVAELFVTGDREFHIAGAMILNGLD